jgi:hypothetical protein
MSDQEKTTQDIIANPELREQLKAIVLERANAMPGTLRIAVGAEKFEKNDLLKHIRDEDEIGKQMMVMELGFLQALTSGAIYANE